MSNPRAPDHPAHPADLTREEWLRLELAICSDEIAHMAEVGSWQAAMAGRRIAKSYRDELDKLTSERDAIAA